MKSTLRDLSAAAFLIVIAGFPAGALAVCTDPAAVCAARAKAETQCPCATAVNHGDYVRCVRAVAKAEVDALRLPRNCKGAVVRCAARSTCGRPTFVTCCRPTSTGVRCSVKRDATLCKAPATVGTKPSCCDACGDGCTASTTTSTTTTINTTTTTTTTTTTQPPVCGNNVVESPEQCDPPGSLTCAGSAEGAFLACNADCTCPPRPLCCGFPGRPRLIRFENVVRHCDSGSLTLMGGGTMPLKCSGLYFGGGNETPALPSDQPDKGVSISKVTSCSGTALTEVAATAADTGSIRTCSDPSGTCIPGALGSCSATTQTCPGTGTCNTTTHLCTVGKIGLACAANADCDFDCLTDRDCGVCSAGNVGAHCQTDHQCSCLFGAPLATPNLSLPSASTCEINTLGNQFDTAVFGTADCSTGAAENHTPLNSEVYLTGDLLGKRCSGGSNPGFNCISGANCLGGGTCVNDPDPQPCPLCNPTTLKCNGGPNEGASCTPGSSGPPDLSGAYPTSHDCPPPHTTEIGPLPVNIDFTSEAADPNCANPSPPGTRLCSFSTGVTFGKSNVFCPFCRNPVSLAFEKPPHQCTQDADCTDPDPNGGTFSSCEQRSNGAFHHGDATIITENGARPGDVRDGQQHEGHRVGVFCIPPAYDPSLTVDVNGDLPGPGASSLPSTMQLLP